MTGVSFVVDETGKEKAVVLDLSVWGEIWEDMYDVMVARERASEPTISLDQLKKELGIEADDRGSV